MLNKNIKKLRESKGPSREKLATKLGVIRQTVSKQENGPSVPDSSTLVALADELDVPIDILFGEPVTESMPDDMRTISGKLEVINLQLTQRGTGKVEAVRWMLISLYTLMIAASLVFIIMQSSYLGWNYNNPELAVVGIILYGCEFVFVRFTPIAFAVCIIGIAIACKKR